MSCLKIMKVRSNAVVPRRATPGSAGIDLYACLDEAIVVPARGRALVPTGIAIELPESGLAAMIFARSGLAIKHGLGLSNGVGVVDSDYRGEICVGIVNQSDVSYEIQPGERIAQLIVMPVICLPVIEALSLDQTERGTGGFGSTGKM